MSSVDKVPSNYTATGVALGALVAYGITSGLFDLATTGKFNPTNQSTEATILGGLLGIGAAVMTTNIRMAELQKHNSQIGSGFGVNK